MSHAAVLICNEIVEERVRQRTKEGWTLAHDDEHIDGSLASAAACYAREDPPMRKQIESEDQSGGRGDCPVWRDVEYWVPRWWPHSWHPRWWKPKDHRRNLIRAGALIVAEIERLDRAAAKAAPSGSVDQ